MEKIIQIFALAVLGIGLATVCARAADDPEFQGRKLSEWLADEFNRGMQLQAVRPEVQQRSQEAAVAIRAMGTNIIPILLNMLAATETNSPSETAGWPRIRASRAIALFGAEAKFAIPELIELLKIERDGWWPEATALAGIGLDAMIPLSQALTNVDQRMHSGAAMGLQMLCSAHYGQPVLSNAVPALTMALLKDKNAEVREQIAQTMHSLRRPEAVPAMLESLSDTNRLLRSTIINALSYYDYDPETIIAALKKVRDNDPDEGVRIIAGREIEHFSERLKWQRKEVEGKKD